MGTHLRCSKSSTPKVWIVAVLGISGSPFESLPEVLLLVLSQTGYGPAWYALFVAVYAGLEVFSWNLWVQFFFFLFLLWVGFIFLVPYAFCYLDGFTRPNSVFFRVWTIIIFNTQVRFGSGFSIQTQFELGWVRVIHSKFNLNLI